MNTQVFISFSSSDIELCDATYNYLSEKKFDCWRYLDRNRVGDDWFARAQESISSSVALVALVSQSYLVSEVCRAEFDFALKFNIPIFPLRCKGLQFNAMPDEWRKLVFLELRAEYDIPSLEKLYFALKKKGVAPYIPTSAIKVYRPKRFRGSDNDFSIICDDEEIGILRNGETINLVISAGQRVLRAEYDIVHKSYNIYYIRHGASYVRGISPDFQFQFNAGNSYFFKAGYIGNFFTSGGWFGPSKLYFKEF